MAAYGRGRALGGPPREWMERQNDERLPVGRRPAGPTLGPLRPQVFNFQPRPTRGRRLHPCRNCAATSSDAVRCQVEPEDLFGDHQTPPSANRPGARAARQGRERLCLDQSRLLRPNLPPYHSNSPSTSKAGRPAVRHGVQRRQSPAMLNGLEQPKALGLHLWPVAHAGFRDVACSSS